MLLVFIPLLVCLYRKRKGNVSLDKGPVDISDCLVTNETTSSKADVIYVNKAVLEEEAGGYKEDSLHYADVDYAKLQARSEGKLGEGDIKGLASKTGVYSEIRREAPSNGGDAK